MESYPSLSSASAKLNYNNNIPTAKAVAVAANSTTATATSNERKMPLSRSLTQPQGTHEYNVTGSDTLASVAARFQTTPSELARINKITGRFIFPGQILYVPKRNQSSTASTDGEGEVPPNTPNESSRTSSNSTDSILDSPVPGQAQRVLDNTGAAGLFPAHTQLHQTSSSPISTFVDSDLSSLTSASTDATCTSSSAKMVQPSQIDPADRECLERFLKINVRQITDGLGVVTGVLLVTPNALMFDPNVSDPLVIEHGTEIYGVTVPMELVLKTALYTDIAHMRVKHAPEAVPSVPKPAVYYASDDDSGCIFEENLLTAYSTKANNTAVQSFDTISNNNNAMNMGSEPLVEVAAIAEEVDEPIMNEQQQAEEAAEAVESAANQSDNQVQLLQEQQQQQPLINLEQMELSKEEPDSSKNGDDAVHSKQHNNDDNNTSCDQTVREETELMTDDAAKLEEVDHFEDAQESVSTEKSGDNIDRLSSSGGAGAVAGGNNDRLMSEEISIDLTEPISELGSSFDQNKSADYLNQSTDEEGGHLLGSSPQQSNRLSSYFQTKLALSERHSAPLSGNADKIRQPPPLVTAVSAEESCLANESAINKRRSAHGESRREQMLKRLSNPVDTIGSITKSGIGAGINVTKTGFNATKSGISTGFNVTKSGISTGLNATKSGLTTGLNVTKTGFTKVLSTPKNLMDFSSGLVRDAKGALGTGSKSDNDLSEHLGPEKVRKADSALGYTNMVDTKVDAFDNFDKLIPRPARHSKDPPLYLCIRMGKHKRTTTKRNQRFSPTYSFGRKKYEREYWFSVPKEKAKNLYHFFAKWAPEVYGDVDDLREAEKRGLEPITTDDELECEESEEAEEDEYGTKDGAAGAGDKSGENKENDGKLNAAAAGGNKTKFWRRRSPLNFLKLVEDHFSTDGMSTDWNISNSSEDHSFAERYMLGGEPAEPILPDINGPTELLTADIIRNLSKHLPARAEGYAWSLVYSTSTHGFSLNTLYREMKRFDSPVLVIIEDTNGAIFGALLSNSLQQSDHFYGTGETFLFTFHPDFACYPWTGENLFFIKGNADSISVGAGEGNFGLWLDGDLYHGSSHPCKTFGNHTLSSEEDFVVKSIECWGFV